MFANQVNRERGRGVSFGKTNSIRLTHMTTNVINARVKFRGKLESREDKVSSNWQQITNDNNLQLV